ncbi:MAG: AMP-binding protein, partial [bacterium]|nr:AMP-binding protein [bacterium]
KPGDTITIENVIRQIHRHLRERREYENTPLVNIKEYSSLDEQDALFDTILVLENYPLDEKLKQKGGPLTIDSFNIAETTHYDLTVAITMFEGIQLAMDYNKTLFEKEELQSLTGHFENILLEMVNKPGKHAAAVTLMSEEEKDKILYQFNQATLPYPADKTIHQLFETQVQKTPDKISIVGNNLHSPTIQLTYRQLNEDTQHLAAVLHAQGVAENDLVGILADRTGEMITGILAILKAGCGYVPLNPK